MKTPHTHFAEAYISNLQHCNRGLCCDFNLENAESAQSLRRKAPSPIIPLFWRVVRSLTAQAGQDLGVSKPCLDSPSSCKSTEEAPVSRVIKSQSKNPGMLPTYLFKLWLAKPPRT